MMRNPFSYSVIIRHDSTNQYIFLKTGLLSQIKKMVSGFAFQFNFFLKKLSTAAHAACISLTWGGGSQQEIPGTSYLMRVQLSSGEDEGVESLLMGSSTQWLDCHLWA